MNSSLNSLSHSVHEPVPARRIPAWIVPTAIITGFALLFLALFRDRLRPAADVKVALVLATVSDSTEPAPAAGKAADGGMLFQASGWIEPDPLPIKATALVDGIIDTVHILEGQTVEKGDTLATLIPDDARLSLATWEQNHRTLLASRDAHLAAIDSAGNKLAGARAIEKSAAAMRDDAADRMRRFDKLSSLTVPEQDVVAARYQFAREDAQLLAAAATAAEAESEIRRLHLETLVRENEILKAAIEVEKAKLALARTVVTSPADGRVLRLLAAPGQKKMLQDNEMESATVAILYQPAKLQVRVDVPLADAANLQIGQKTKIRCSLLPDRVFDGVVTRISGEADVQRNTLQAKVGIANPVDQLRPEMLCRVEFLPVPASSAELPPSATDTVATWIPESAARDGSAWVCDPESNRVSRRAIRRTPETREGHIRISEGLRPGEWVIITPRNLAEGQRVNPTLTEP